MRETQREPGAKRQDSRNESDHLRYLLTAYLLENISEEGRREVETHLEECAECRGELEALRGTLGLVEEALGPEASEDEGEGEDETGTRTPIYSFEEHRQKRVLEMAAKRRWGARHWGFAVASAAALLLASLMPGLLRVQRRASEGERSDFLARHSPAVRGRVPETARREATLYDSKPADGDVETAIGLGGGTAGRYGNRWHKGQAKAETAVPPPGTPPAVATPPAAPAEAAAPEAEPDATTETLLADARDAGRPAAELERYFGTTRTRTTASRQGGRPASGPSRARGKPGGGAGAAGDIQMSLSADRPVMGQRSEVDFTDLPDLARDRAETQTGEFDEDPRPSRFETPAGAPVDGKANAAKNKRAKYISGRVTKVAPGADEEVPVGGQELRNVHEDFAYRRNEPIAQREAVKKLDEVEQNLTEGKDRWAGYSGKSVRLLPAQKREDLPQLQKRLEQVAAGNKPSGGVEVTGEALEESTRRWRTPNTGYAVSVNGTADRKRLKSHGAASKEAPQLDFFKSYFEVAEAPQVQALDGFELHYKRAEKEEEGRTETDLPLDDAADDPAGFGDVGGIAGNVAEYLRGGEEVQGLVAAFDWDLNGRWGVAGGKHAALMGVVRNDGTLALDPSVLRKLSAHERQLRAFAHYRALDQELTYEQFAGRRLSIPPPAVGDEGLGREGFRARYGVNPFVPTSRDTQSTFGLDVDTAAWDRTKNYLRSGRLPPPEEVRVEEYVNSFPEEVKADPEAVFSVFTEGGPSPFGAGLDLLKITVEARDLKQGERKDLVLTLAVDTSGSMALDRRIETVRSSLERLVHNLRPGDRVGIVAFGGGAYVVLPHTSAREKERILAALSGLSPDGATHFAAGLDLAYRLADEGRHPRALNRVILCSDGAANVGARGPEDLLRRIGGYRNRTIYLSVLGFGEQKYNDALLRRLADEGNGNYSYVGTLAKADELFGRELFKTLDVLAQDAKIQVEFNAETVSHYRLLGYEKRDIADKDFRDDRIDAGEVGPGTTVTVLYEVLRKPAAGGSLGTIYLRYRDTTARRVEEVEFDIASAVVAARLQETSDRFRFIACVAELAEVLRQSYYARDGSLGAVVELLHTVSPATRAREDWKEVEEMARKAQGLTFLSLRASK